MSVSSWCFQAVSVFVSFPLHGLLMFSSCFRISVVPFVFGMLMFSSCFRISVVPFFLICWCFQAVSEFCSFLLFWSINVFKLTKFWNSLKTSTDQNINSICFIPFVLVCWCFQAVSVFVRSFCFWYVYVFKLFQNFVRSFCFGLLMFLSCFKISVGCFSFFYFPLHSVSIFLLFGLYGVAT